MPLSGSVRSEQDGESTGRGERCHSVSSSFTRALSWTLQACSSTANRSLCALLLSSFGDVHYFYGPSTANPPHHRFDKGSYVYLFENANERRARVEVANQPGSDDQDAFDGCERALFLVRTSSRACPRADQT